MVRKHANLQNVLQLPFLDELFKGKLTFKSKNIL